MHGRCYLIDFELSARSWKQTFQWARLSLKSSVQCEAWDRTVPLSMTHSFYATCMGASRGDIVTHVLSHKAYVEHPEILIVGMPRAWMDVALGLPLMLKNKRYQFGLAMLAYMPLCD